MRTFFLLLIALASTAVSTVAQHRVDGVVRDAATGEPLQFANVWLKDSHKGTTTDREGRFTLSLDAGAHALSASYIGYRSELRSVRVPGSGEIIFTLQQQSIEMPTVTVTPGDNPALRIIRRAIESKEKRKEKLQNYSLTSHSKLRLRVEGALAQMSAGGGSVTVGADSDEEAVKDSAGKPLPILLETQTDAWWARPDRYKEVVKARKQSAFVPAQANFMISAFFIIDFSADELNLSGKAPLIGPISESGLDSYYYRLIGETMVDSTKLYMIEISPLAESEPLLEGMIYIADETYALSMVDVRLNEAALPQFFDFLGFKQHFRLFDSEFWMPVDVVIDAGIDVSFVDIQVEIEGLSVLQDYRINDPINDDFFDRTRIKVLKEADERDSTYWVQNLKIPNTDEELQAYRRADSVKLAIDSAQYAVGLGSILMGGTTGSDAVQYSFPGLLGLYRYNRVEGHALDGEFGVRFDQSPLRSISAGAGYGFSDERLKYRLGASAALFSSPRLVLRASRYYRLDFIDRDSDPASDLLVTSLSLFGRYDHRDYFYRDGWSARLAYDPWLLFPMAVDVGHDRYFNAAKNSDWSIFGGDKHFRGNPAVNEGSIFRAGGSLSFDNRDFIDNAGEISRFGARNHVPRLRAAWHDADLEGRQWTILTYGADLGGRFDLGLYGLASYRVSADATADALPTQLLFNLHGSINYLSSGGRFRTLTFREFGGDRRATVFLTHNFRDWLFRALKIPFLRESGWSLELFASGGWTAMRDDTRDLQKVLPAAALQPFWEAGFGVDGIFSLFRVDLAWRLNHFREGRNFFIGLSSGILM